MDIMKMMKQAQTIQKRLKDVQDELSAAEYEAETAGGAVKVTVDGQGRFKAIKLSATAINPDNPDSVDTDTIEMLEDLIATAICNASEDAVKVMEEKMKAVTGGITIPGLF